MTKYVIVTTVLSYRMRYCIPVDELQQLNTEVSVEGREIEWAEDCVTCNEVEEFSQHPIGERIIDAVVIDEDAMLEQFDKDNDYLAGWTKEKKIQHIRNWKYGKRGYIE
jgi:hypothetical protein